MSQFIKAQHFGSLLFKSGSRAKRSIKESKGKGKVRATVGIASGFAPALLLVAGIGAIFWIASQGQAQASSGG